MRTSHTNDTLTHLYHNLSTPTSNAESQPNNPAWTSESVSSRGEASQVKSDCAFAKDFSLTAAETGCRTNPSTNRPRVCVHCRLPDKCKLLPTVWTYNMEQHFREAHPECPSITDFRLSQDFRRSIQITKGEQEWLKIPQK